MTVHNMIKYNIPNRNPNNPYTAPRPLGLEELPCALCQDTDEVPLRHKFSLEVLHR